MDLATYLGTVAALITLAGGAMYVVVGQLGHRIQEQGAGLGARIDELGTGVNARIDDLTARVSRIETQNDAILAAVGDLGQRITHLEARSA